MRVAILSIGTELTRGELVNTNAAWLAEQLTALGCEVGEHATVADDSEAIGATLARFGREVKLVVCTGGLGPTSDDLTAESVARALSLPLVRHEPSLERIEERYRRAGRRMPGPNAKQADLPQGAEALDNAHGTAPGFAITVGEARCVFMPGVPAEMRAMFETHVAPELSRVLTRNSYQVHIRTFGLRESEVAERLAALDRGGPRAAPGVVLGYRAHFPEIEVKVYCRAADDATARTRAEAVAEEARALLSPFAYGSREDSFPGYIGGLLRSRGWSLALAESCTGGLVAKLLTDVSGSSDFLRVGFVTYANEAKRDVLGVDQALLDRHGAVSEEVACAMAEGALERGLADLAVAITGIAGPNGGSEDKPVGTVCFGLARRAREHGDHGGNTYQTYVERRLLSGDRARIRTLSAYVALSLIAAAVTDSLDGVNGAPVQPLQEHRGDGEAPGRSGAKGTS